MQEQEHLERIGVLEQEIEDLKRFQTDQNASSIKEINYLKALL